MILWVALCLLSLNRLKLASDEKIFISGWNTVSTLHYCIRDNILHFNGEIRKYSRLKKFENMFRCFSYCNLHTTMLEASNTLFSKLVSNSEPQWRCFGMCLYDTRSNYDRVQFLIHSTFTWWNDFIFGTESCRHCVLKRRASIEGKTKSDRLGVHCTFTWGYDCTFVYTEWCKHCILKWRASIEGKKKLDRLGIHCTFTRWGDFTFLQTESCKHCVLKQTAARNGKDEVGSSWSLF